MTAKQVGESMLNYHHEPYLPGINGGSGFLFAWIIAMNNCLRFLAVLMIVTTLTGCVDSQLFRERRITHNQEAFNSFSPDIQAKIRAGEIDIGFSQTMVYLAWGKADRIYTRITAQGAATVWDYTGTRIKTESSWVSVPVSEINKDGRSVIRYRRVWLDKDSKEEFTVARVEFIGDLVSAIEQLN